MPSSKQPHVTAHSWEVTSDTTPHSDKELITCNNQASLASSHDTSSLASNKTTDPLISAPNSINWCKLFLAKQAEIKHMIVKFRESSANPLLSKSKY